MYFFKLFLSATFAIIVVARALLAVLGATVIEMMPSLTNMFSGVGASIAFAVASFAAGAVLAQVIRKRNVPKATHG